MASCLRQAAWLCKASFQLVVVSAPPYMKALSVGSWLSAALQPLLPWAPPASFAVDVKKAKDQWIKFEKALPQNADTTLFCRSVAKELAAAYHDDAESKRDAACWASEMAKWESAAGYPQFQQYRHNHKEVQELSEGVLSRILHCQGQGILANAATFWNCVATKRNEDAAKLSKQAKVEPDEAMKQALTKKAKEAKHDAREAVIAAMIFSFLFVVIPGLICGVALGHTPPRYRIKLLRLFGILSEQEAEFAMIVESNDGVPAVLTNFRGCRKSTVCKRYEAHAWLIGHKCVYISRDPEKKTSSIEVLDYILGHLPSIAHIICFVAMLPAVRFPRIAATAAVGFGLLVPAYWKPGVVIFDDVTSVTTYGTTAGEIPSAGAKKGAADDKSKLAEYTNIPGVVGAAYNGRKYDGRGWIQVVVSSNEGIRLLQRDSIESKYGYESFPTASAEELQGAIKEYIKKKLRESKKIGTRSKASEKNFPPPTVDEIERAVERYGEWWGRSIRFWILPFNNNNAGFHERMRSAELTAEDIGKLAAELDLSCSSGPAPLIGSPPIDVSEFNEAFAAIKGKGLLEDAVRGLYGNNNRDIDVNHFPRRLLHSVMYSLVTSDPITVFTDKLEEKLADVNKRPVPLSKGSWELSRALLSPLRQGWLKRIRRFLIFWGKNPSCSEKSGKGIISDKMQTREDCLKKTERS